MALKYQHNIDELGITSICPPNDLQRIDSIAFRWVYDPINHALNFLPNYEFDKAKGDVSRYENGTYDNKRKCMRCCQSFFTTLDAAKITHRKLPKKVKDFLGYTHVATGEIEKVDGASSEVNNSGHFSFFEDAQSDLLAKFNICDQLDSWL